MLCRACKRMFQGDLTYADEHSYVPTAHHLTAEDLCAAAEQKCRICTRVWRTFSKNGHVDLLALQPKSSFTGYLFNDSEHAVGRTPSGCYELYIILDQIALEGEPLKGERGYPQVCIFVLQPVKGTFDNSEMASNLCILPYRMIQTLLYLLTNTKLRSILDLMTAGGSPKLGSWHVQHNIRSVIGLLARACFTPLALLSYGRQTPALDSTYGLPIKYRQTVHT